MTDRRSPATIFEIVSTDPELQEAFEGRRYAREAALLLNSMRLQAGLTKSDLARRMGVKPPRISEVEMATGRNGPTYRFMRKAAEACGYQWPVTIADLKPLRPHSNEHEGTKAGLPEAVETESSRRR